MKKSAILLAMLVALLVTPAAVLAQETEGDTEARADGRFRLTLNGEAPENFSFWVESNVGDGGVICTTDAAMVGTGIPECKDGGEVNEMSYSVPSGSTLDYRIVGSQGVELSQEVVAEGSQVVGQGFVVDASYTFSGEPTGDVASGTQPAGASPTDDKADDKADDETANENGDGAAGTQYEDASSGSVEESSGKDDPTTASGVLPDTGGSSIFLVAGAVLLLAAGGFFAYRSIS